MNNRSTKLRYKFIQSGNKDTRTNFLHVVFVLLLSTFYCKYLRTFILYKSHIM